MRQSDLDWKSGTVLHWNMEFIDFDIPLENQLSELKEDLAQIGFPGGLIIDVGWYPEFSKEGAFLVTVIKDGDWDEPLAKETCSSASALLSTLTRFITIAEQNG